MREEMKRVTIHVWKKNEERGMKYEERGENEQKCRKHHDAESEEKGRTGG